MTASLQALQNLLDNTEFDQVIPVHREDLENVVKLAGTVGIDASTLLESFDAITDGYQQRIRRQTQALGELVGRIGAVETTLRELSKSDEIHPELISAFGTIIGILRNGAKKES